MHRPNTYGRRQDDYDDDSDTQFGQKFRDWKIQWPVSNLAPFG